MKKLLVIALGLALTGVFVQADDGDKKPAKPAAGPRGEALKKYDKNGDGKLDETERAAMKKDREAEMLKKFDKNGDGKLDDAEKEAAKAAGAKGRGEGKKEEKK